MNNHLNIHNEIRIEKDFYEELRTLVKHKLSG